ncbi:KdsC family phosphatase [Sphingobacterium yanglingense]|uniref:3-deoxy-D-manno-octulosonate 8-phosphate phosphatase (KDO 8-P phosphatase) n=1 Tax=Sphingobacterium yanglingense TaxID=1437280 RepID=A0A4R6WNR7_9SPHI|nr:HAD-IIIA family hydrolase [Sphingobacterium yanglingense]TDQ82814.1 3-deoxy-D-manno-octulosonate 8-phosphate phosphatase (KDO 8-P phosphatase) [Sphingobacterium yanglingense]
MIYSTLKNIKCIVLDVDGVLTDGAILVNENGEQLRTFNVKDGYAIQYAVKQGLLVFVITGGRSQGVLKRMEGLHVPEIHLGVSDKLSLLEELAARYGLSLADIAFIGDDMPDYSCMQQVGAAIAPADAVEDIKRVSHYVSTKRGGEGVVREIIEKVLRLQDKWHTEVLIKSI